MATTTKNTFSSMNEALEILTEGVIDIYFIKKTTGQVRRLHATLDKFHIPHDNYNSLQSILEKASIGGSESFPLPVWDVGNQGWRSFYLGSTIEIIPSPVYGDTRAIVKQAIGEQPTEDELTEEMTEEIVETVTQTIKNKITRLAKDAPEKLLDFTFDKIKESAITMVRNQLKKKF